MTASIFFVCSASDAQIKKTWDFSIDISEETAANLNADSKQWTPSTDGNTGSPNWTNTIKGNIGAFKSNDVVLPEFLGLEFSGDSKKNSNYVITKNATFNAEGNLSKGTFRLNRLGDIIKLPKLASGQKITIVAKSANATSARGIKANTTNITKLEGPENDVAVGSEGWQTWIYQVNEGFTDSVDVSFKSLEGPVDVWSIIIDEGDAPAVQEDKKVAYLYNGTDYDENNDMVWTVLSGSDGMVTTAIDIANGATDVTLDSLQRGYDVVVVSPYTNATDTYVTSTLKSAIAYAPVLNLNPSLYAAWGYGNVIKSEENFLTIKDADNPLFKDANVAALISEGTLSWLADGTVTGVNLGSYFAEDDTLATVGAGIAIHKHNPNRNAYMLLPYDKDEQAGIDGDAMSAILPAAVLELAKSKKDVSAVPTPKITEVYGNKQTQIVLSNSNKSAELYYTLDGSDPTKASTLYTDTLTLTEALTVKAIAYADGYNPSDVAELTATIKDQAATPTFEVSSESGKSTVTISSATEGATIYYNYIGSTKVAESKIYSDPIEVTEPLRITAFATSDKSVNSEPAYQFVDVKDAAVRYDILTSFDANRNEWTQPEDETGTAKAVYLFSWGNKAQSMYDTSAGGTTQIVYGPDGQPLKNQNGEDSTIVVYPEVPAETKANADWSLESQGQIITWENTTPLFNVGDGNNYNPETAEDAVLANDTIGITKFMVNFGGKASGEPYNARLRTNKSYAGPFDIVVYASNGNGENYPVIEIQTSTDGTSWDSLSTVDMASTKRIWKRTKATYSNETPAYVRLFHKSGGSKGIIYNVYLLNAGEHTQQWLAGIKGVFDGTTGNEATITHIYNLNGVRQNTLQRGVNIIRYSDGSVRKVMKK